MSIELKFKCQGREASVLARGTPTHTDIEEIGARLYRPARLARLRRVLMDWRDVDATQLRPQHIRAMASRDVRAALVHGSLAIAMVANGDLMFGYMRMWEARADSEALRCATFRNLSHAKEWLRAHLRQAISAPTPPAPILSWAQL